MELTPVDRSRDAHHGTARRERLFAWTRQVFADAGIDPTEEQVEEIFRSIAAWILTRHLVPFAEQKGVARVETGDTLFVAWVAMNEIGAPNVIQRWDEMCDVLVVMIADEQVGRDHPRLGAVQAEVGRELDALIETELADLHDEYVAGVSEEFGPSAGARSPAGAAAGGCALMAAAMIAAGAALTSLRR